MKKVEKRGPKKLHRHKKGWINEGKKRQNLITENDRNQK